MSFFYVFLLDFFYFSFICLFFYVKLKKKTVYEAISDRMCFIHGKLLLNKWAQQLNINELKYAEPLTQHNLHAFVFLVHINAFMDLDTVGGITACRTRHIEDTSVSY